ADGMKLTATIDNSQVPPILGSTATLLGARLKIEGSTKLEIRKDQADGILVLKSTSFALNQFGLQLSPQSEPLVTDLSSKGEALLSLNLAGDALQLQKASLVKSGFQSAKPYRIVIEGQTITG